MPPYHGNPTSIVAFTSPLVIVAKSSFPSMIQLSSVAGGSKVQFSSEIQAFLVALVRRQFLPYASMTTSSSLL